MSTKANARRSERRASRPRAHAKALFAPSVPRGRRIRKTRDPLLRAQAEALESYVYAHGRPVIRYTPDGERQHFRCCKFGSKNYRELAEAGWRQDDIYRAMRETYRRGGHLYGEWPGVLCLEVRDEDADLECELAREAGAP